MTFAQLVKLTIDTILNPVISLIFVIAILAFFWGIAKYIFNSGDPKARSDGAWMMTAGVLGLFVMVSVWGLVAVLQNTFNLESNSLPTIFPRF